MNNKIKCLTNVKNILFEKFISWNQGNADKSFWEYSYRFGQYREQIGFFKHLI